MGWRKKLSHKLKKVAHKYGDKIDAHAVAIKQIEKATAGTRANKNTKKEGVKAVANYGGYAGLAAQVVPGVGTAIGVGILAATTAAQIKMRQDAIALEKRRNHRRKGAWLRSTSQEKTSEPVVFAPTTREASTKPSSKTADGGYSSPPIMRSFTGAATNVASNMLGDMGVPDAFSPARFLEGDGGGTLAETGSAPSGASFAPDANAAELMTGAEPESFFDTYRIEIAVVSLLAAVLTIFTLMKK
jgi:hypothetical protein